MRTLFGYGTPREMAAALAAPWNVLLRFVLEALDGFAITSLAPSARRSRRLWTLQSGLQQLGDPLNRFFDGC